MMWLQLKILVSFVIVVLQAAVNLKETCRLSDIEKPPKGSVPVDTKEYLRCNKMRPVVSLRIREKLRPFHMSDSTLIEIQRIFLNDVRKGLARSTHETSTIKSYITYVQDLPTGNETGKYISLDLSGSYLRVILVELGGTATQMQSQSFSISRHIMRDSGEHLFDHIADCLYRFMKDQKLLGETLQLGFTFGFPLIQRSLTSGILRRWTKGFNCSDTVGNDVVQMLQAAIKRRGIPGNVIIQAIINDTTGIFIATAYFYPDTRVGVIVSAGSNACYMEKQSNAQMFDAVDMGSGSVLVNCEWGAFGDDGTLEFVRTPFDKEIDQNSVNPGKQIYEKMISGMYMGELVRLVMENFTREGLLFKGVGTEALFTKDRFPAKYVSAIEADRMGTYTNCIEVLEDMGLMQAVEQDRINVKYVCSSISKRAAYLVASTLSALLNKIGDKKVTIAVAGALFKYHPHFTKLVEKKIRHLVTPGIEFELQFTPGGNEMGAALLAAVAGKYNVKKEIT